MRNENFAGPVARSPFCPPRLLGSEGSLKGEPPSPTSLVRAKRRPRVTHKIFYQQTLFIIMLMGILQVLFSPINIWGEDMKEISLPKPRMKGDISVEEAIQTRRSVRSFSSKEVSLEDISQLLWACQGITDERRGFRASPSAGALYPLEIYVVTKDGVLQYIPDAHKLEVISNKDIRKDLALIAYGQGFIAQACLNIVICVVYERVTSKYGKPGVAWTHIEVGHAAQNIFLQAVALGLDSAPIGAFSDAEVSKILNLPYGVKPLYILPVGYRR